MSTNTKDTYLAVFLGSKTSPRTKAWMALPEAERRAKEQEGIAAWKTWAEKHHDAVSAMGGPLGKTKKITERAIEDVSNEMGAFMVVRADRMRRRPSCSKSILISRSFRANPSRSCQFCRYRALMVDPQSTPRRTNHHPDTVLLQRVLTTARAKSIARSLRRTPLQNGCRPTALLAPCISWKRKSAARSKCPSGISRPAPGTRLAANMSSSFRTNACATRTRWCRSAAWNAPFAA